MEQPMADTARKSPVVLMILLVLVVVVAAVLILAARKPDTFRIERSATIKAPPEKIFPLIDSFPAWTSWSPYDNRDPNMKRTYGAVSTGKGATYGWDGNKDIGSGSMEILEATPPSKVVIKLDFTKPFEAHNTAEFTLVPVGDGTTVTWAMYGPQLFMGKVMGLFFNMDKMVGGDFETGLASLKAVAEK
jgi:uncharacterized protein YndB with AHSA1/START domain